MSTILQISDPHLMSKSDGTLKGVPTAESFGMVLQRARAEVPDPARVVLTGDLSHEHTVDGYELLKDILGDWTERSLLIPGNHDDRLGMRTVFHQVPGHDDDEILFREELEKWLLIGLDSHVPDEVYGELSEGILEKLDVWLSENPDRPTLIFLHHPPVPVGSRWIDKIGLRNPTALKALIGSSPGIRGLFCGHIHQVFEGSFAGKPFFSAPAASFQFLPKSEVMELDLRPEGFRVIELQEMAISTRAVRLDAVHFPPRNE